MHAISAGENPATWMLEVTGGASVTGQSRAASVDFAEYYKVPRRISQSVCMLCSCFTQLDAAPLPRHRVAAS